MPILVPGKLSNSFQSVAVLDQPPEELELSDFEAVFDANHRVRFDFLTGMDMGKNGTFRAQLEEEEKKADANHAASMVFAIRDSELDTFDYDELADYYDWEADQIAAEMEDAAQDIYKEEESQNVDVKDSLVTLHKTGLNESLGIKAGDRVIYKDGNNYFVVNADGSKQTLTTEQAKVVDDYMKKPENSGVKVADPASKEASELNDSMLKVEAEVEAMYGGKASKYKTSKENARDAAALGEKTQSGQQLTDSDKTRAKELIAQKEQAAPARQETPKMVVAKNIGTGLGGEGGGDNVKLVEVDAKPEVFGGGGVKQEVAKASTDLPVLDKPPATSVAAEEMDEDTGPSENKLAFAAAAAVPEATTPAPTPVAVPVLQQQNTPQPGSMT